MSRLGRFASLLAVIALAAAAVAIALLGASGSSAGLRRTPRLTELPAPARSAAAGPTRPPGGRSVVVMLFDGFAASLVEAVSTPALDRMRGEGAWTHRLLPAYPSLSLVNGFTISTGCWPARHGIVSNRFLDPPDGLFDHGRDADWILGCEQLHEVAERQGVRTAALGWYGVVSGTRGALASEVDELVPGASYVSDAKRAEDIVALLRRPEGERPELILAYLSGPDDIAHFSGLDSVATLEAVRAADAAVATVVAAIEDAGLRERIALLVTTDHGMVPVTRLVNIERILRRLDLDARVIADGATAFVYLDDRGDLDEAAERLGAHELLDVVRKEDQPRWSRLGTGPRVGDLIVSVEPPLFMADRRQWPWYAKWMAVAGPETIRVGDRLKAHHGYPPHTPGMQGILYAWGSGIASVGDLGAVQAVEIHPTVARLLGISPGDPVDGRGLDDLLADASGAAASDASDN